MNDNSNSSFLSQNALFIEELYNEYLKNPDSVDESWKEYFSELETSNDDFRSFFSGPSWKKKGNKIIGYQDKVSNNVKKEKANSSNTNDLSLKIGKLIEVFRSYGHTAVKLDPLNMSDKSFPRELDYKNYEIKEEELEQQVYVGGAFGQNEMPLKKLYQNLINTYSGRFAIEFAHMDDLQEREWLRIEIENDVGVINLGKEKELEILDSLVKVGMLEEYLHTKFPGAKRFSIEGGEGTVTAIEEIIQISAKNNIEEMIFGMAHRGRLSILTKVMRKPYHVVFSEFKGGVFIPDNLNLPGDVKYHVGSSSDIQIDGKDMHLTLTPNPSHLEVVNSVVLGRVRAKQDLIDDKDRSKVMGVLLHGDAAFSGQGSVMESLALAGTKAYDIGGTIHIITNNQIGFTTNASDGRSSRYCTDIAKMISAPIFHVNGDDPEAIAYVSRIAAKYRSKFKKDVFIDIVCYRKYGHNEGDEPMFTQPKMYNVIHAHKSPSELYFSKLLDKGNINKDLIQKNKKEFKEFLNNEFELSNSYKPQEADWLKNNWEGFDEFLTDNNSHIVTGVKSGELKNLSDPLTNVPDDLKLNKKVERLLNGRKQMLDTGDGIDWGMGETLAYASLLKDGCDIRFTGEDVERGTFSHRHAVLVDQESERKYIPLNNLENNQGGNIEIHNSILSELAVMGFEYGYSYSSPNTLVIWEAQFGDFANSAQMVIDQYLVSGKDKWLRMSGLVLLLPHGYEGQGPEHSSARLERFLQLGANNNITIANCTTPASIFHLLRRQALRNYRNPLIVMTPKSLLRHRLAVSKLADFAEGTSFKSLIEDDFKEVDKVEKVIFCSGKVYYDLFEEREKQEKNNVALVRLEELYPYAKREILEQLDKYKNAKQIIWCQEEHKNMGAWHYIKPKFEEVLKELGSKLEVEYVGRDESASPAAGYMKLHLEELSKFLKKAFE